MINEYLEGQRSFRAVARTEEESLKVHVLELPHQRYLTIFEKLNVKYLSTIFNKICHQENVLSKHTHTHI